MSAQATELVQLRPHRLTNFSATELLAAEFPPIQWTIPGLVPEGFTVLSADPKIGKSWMVLDWAIAAATGGPALGAIQVDSRPVGYLALEDGPRRLQGRLKHLGASPEAPGLDSLEMITEIPSGSSAVHMIQRFLESNAERSPLVVLDTIGKARPPRSPAQSGYDTDYRESAAFRDAAARVPGASIVGVHHNNKGRHEDPFHSVSGTLGITGGADTTLVLHRSRNSRDVTMHVTGRDVVEAQYALSFNAGLWSLEGEDLKSAADAAWTNQAAEPLGRQSAQILETVARHDKGICRRALIDETGLPEGIVDTYAGRLVHQGRLQRPQRGFYATPQTTNTPHGDYGFPEHPQSALGGLEV